jgi:hypothetical protein
MTSDQCSLFQKVQSVCLNELYFCDFPSWGQLDFQDTATGFLEAMIDLHHDVFGYLVFISLFVLYLLIMTVSLFAEK